MLALMHAHIDKFRSSAHRVYCRFDDVLRISHEGDNRTVVIGIDVRVKDARRSDSGDRCGDGENGFGPPAFAEVWDAFH